MSDLASIHTVEELVEFISSFIETVPTQEYVDREMSKLLSKSALGELVQKFVYRTEFINALGAKASKADLIQAVCSKAEQSDVATGIARKANLNSLYALEAKVNRLFPFKFVENIAARNALPTADKEKICLVLNAKDDPQVSRDSNGAMYGWSTTQTKWVILSELKYSAEQIAYNAILGKPNSSSAEIDKVVGAVIDNYASVRRLREIVANMHTHTSPLATIEQSVTNSHAHASLPEVFDIQDTDLITIVRDGQMVNVKASTLKAYIKE